jgi:hypothetical protein
MGSNKPHRAAANYRLEFSLMSFFSLIFSFRAAHAER